MAGLNFQTQTIINSVKDKETGKDNFKGTGSEENSLRILKDFIFYKDKAGYGKVLRMVKKLGHDATMCKATLNFTNLALAPESGVKYYRLDIYLGVEGAEPFIYSNPWVQKGMPLWVEFAVPASEPAATTVNKLAETIKSTHAFLCDKDLIKVTPSSANLELEGATEYQRFKKIEIVEFKDNEIYETKVAKIDGSKITLNKRGSNGFGTYSHVIKDLRLPTAANYQWSHIRKSETPIVDAIYDQYIIDYEAPATNDGLGCVGQRMNSVTTHVFWVQHGAAQTALDAAIGASTIDISTSSPTAIETASVDMHTLASEPSSVQAAKASPLKK